MARLESRDLRVIADPPHADVAIDVATRVDIQERGKGHRKASLRHPGPLPRGHEIGEAERATASSANFREGPSIWRTLTRASKVSNL